MVQKLFNALSSDFSDPNNWRPTGVPQSGDVAAVLKASAVASGVLPDGVLIEVTTFANNGISSFLTLQDAIVPAGTRIQEGTSFSSAVSIRSSLQFAGAVINQGTIDFAGDPQTVTLPAGTTLTNDGTINLTGFPQFSAVDASVPITNDGLIRVVNPGVAIGQLAVLGPALAGTGTITVSKDAGVEFGSAVGSGQKLQFVGGSGAGATVQIDQSTLFGATIDGFVAGDTLKLANTASTSVSFSASGTGSGTLQIFNGGSAPVASLQFAGVYSTDNFSVSQSGTSLSITTNVTNPATGGTTPTTSSGVYRFFETSDGTHFYTASVTERDFVLFHRPDLVEETNGFGAVTTASSTSESVYRFFDTAHGTHFFTASSTERDQAIATRPDLTYEPSATFLEDATPQAGDIAVYRLFSKTDGTHLYTGSYAELGALTTPAGSSYRADLVSEGVSFYAPPGSYT